ncbi:hypothetical protein XENOCAPTIV_000551 [Xenoophorus captivus]|uniref:26S proteasome regulatory subunit RPN2 C-terminal domain-containing protein n=1 Tax=Xenoophorus captivus TaxID=1517983 RepID=A0ABV0RJ92_9TELE
MPKVQYRSNCKPSTFAYPPALEVPKEKEKEKLHTGGIIILRDTSEAEEELVEPVSAHGPKIEEEEQEPEPPEPFEYIDE